MQVSFILKQLETGDVCWILDPSPLPLVLGTCVPSLFHPSTFLPPTLLTFHFSLAMLSFLFVVLCFSLISVFSFIYITPTTSEKACFTENHAFSANSDTRNQRGRCRVPSRRACLSIPVHSNG